MACLEAPLRGEESATQQLVILDKIARGAFGEVYKGCLDEEVCAVKMITASSESQRMVHQMYLREAEILMQCTHSRIIGFKGLVHVDSSKKGKHVSKLGGSWALVFEYAKGGALSNTVVQQMVSPSTKVYTRTQALQWALDIASGLDYLHSRSPMILHRDIKLSNVLLVKEDNKMVAKLSDFGLHAVLDSSRTQHLRICLSQGPNTRRSFRYTLVNCATETGEKSTSLTAPAKHSPAVSCSGGSASICDDINHSCDQGSNHSIGSDFGNSKAVNDTIKAHSGTLGYQLQCAGDTQDVHASTICAGTQQLGMLHHNLSCCIPDGSCVEPQLVNDKQCRRPNTAADIIATMDSLATNPVSPGAAHNAGLHATGATAPGKLVQSTSTGLPESTSASAPGPAVGQVPAGMKSEAQAAAAASTERVQRPVAPGCGMATVKPESARGQDSTVQGDSLGDVLAHDTDPSACWKIKSSVCSISTDADMPKSSTSSTVSAAAIPASSNSWTGSSCHRGDSSCVTGVELVFDLTGQTGSCMYMAPEVFLGQPYNEKADVFSFGVVLYELIAQCMLVFTELPTSTTDPTVTELYAKKVSEGYRPSKPKRMSSDVRELITACWQQEPMDRPNMKQVITALEQLISTESGQPAGSGADKLKMSQTAPKCSLNPTGTCAAVIRSSDAATGVSKVDASASDPPRPVTDCRCVIC